MKKVFSLVLVIFLLVLGACGTKDDSATTSDETQTTATPKEDLPIVTIELSDGSTMKLELYPDIAPNTVNNFISLINKGYYDGLIFHRIIPGFMVQGGDPAGDGTGGPGYTIDGEFKSNGYNNNLKHEFGVLSMARQGQSSETNMGYNTAGSQFFIMTASTPSLDGDYAAFGKLIEGSATLNKIGNVATDDNDKPLEDVVIKKMTVDTKGITYPEPVTTPTE